MSLHERARAMRPGAVLGHALHLATSFNIAVFVAHCEWSGGRVDPCVALAYGVAASIFLDLVVGRHGGAGRSGPLHPWLAALALAIPICASLIAASSVLLAALILPQVLAGQPLRLLGAALWVGVLNATLGCVSAHELIHSRSRPVRGVGALALAASCQFSFYRAHTHGHHRDVATPADPSTARLGESLFRFLPRAVLGNARKAFALERRRLVAQGRHFWAPRNATLLLACAAALIPIGLALVSARAALFFMLQSAVAIATLEALNYVQHYGLLRAIDADGRPEPIGARHAFDSPYWFSNLGLLNLLRHADHHASRDRLYPELRELDASPKLPLPIFAMLLLATCPPLWRRVMDPRALAANEAGRRCPS